MTIDNIHYTSCCETSAVPSVVLLYVDGVSVILKVAAEVDVVTLAVVLEADAVDVADVLCPGDVDLAAVDKLL